MWIDAAEAADLQRHSKDVEDSGGTSHGEYSTDREEARVPNDFSYHGLSIRADLGNPYQLGLGYRRGHVATGHHGVMFADYGFEFVGNLGSGKFDSFLAFGVGRTGLAYGFFGSSVEIGLGAGVIGGSAQTAGMVALSYSVGALDLGYRFQFPIAPLVRPEALGKHYFSIRIVIPLHREDSVRTDNSK